MSGYFPQWCPVCRKDPFDGAHEYCIPLPDYSDRSERVMAAIRPRKQPPPPQGEKP